MLDLAQAAIRQKVLAEWTATPVSWPNEAFIAPSNAPWILFEIISTGSRANEYGAADKRHRLDFALLWAHVYVPRNTGTDTALALSRQAGSLFDGQMIDTASAYSRLIFKAHSFGGAEDGDDDGIWFRASVSIPFTIITHSPL